MTKKPDAKAFLAALGGANDTEESAKAVPPAAAAPAPVPAQPSAELHTLPTPAQTAKGRGRGKGKPPRAELMHFGGYLNSDTFEKIALLRLRLKKDNSELIEIAIDDLFRKHSAKRAFGDT